MILSDFLKALGQLADQRFRRVMWLGIGLTLALLAGLYVGTVWLVQGLVPEQVTLPWIGPVGGIDTVASWASVVLMLGLSVFLMVPVASAFTGLFLDDVAQAVEDRHYPALPPARPVPWAELLAETAGFFALMLVMNIVMIGAWFLAGPLAPLVFWAVNGFLLGREYFQVAASRRIGREGARTLRSAHAAQIWAAGVLMAVPLSVPVVNLFVPVLGAATFTHLFHRVNGDRDALPG